MTSVRLATAPVSFGIFGSAATEHSARDVVAAMASAGFDGTELGPPGLFGEPEECAALLDEFGLTAVGAYVGLHLAGDDDQFTADLEALVRTTAELVACAPGSFVILADEGDDLTRANPARHVDHEVRWSERDWFVATGRIERLLERITDGGLTPSFHPHLGTYVENRREVELLLDRTEVDLTLDTGHFLLGGIDPVAALADYEGRINHLHAKDVRSAGIPATEVALHADLDDWWGDISSPLGDGDVDLEGFVAALPPGGHDWIVIEQDRDPAPAGSLEPIGRAETANRRWLDHVIARHPQINHDHNHDRINKGEPA
jgi:inosose dehydratase